MMKKALMEELPIRDAISSIEHFMSNGKLEENEGPLAAECETIETGKRLALYIFNEALNRFGQDLKHEQQLTEILADIFMDIYSAESTVVRARKIMAGNSPESTVVDIAKVFTMEMANRIMGQVHIALGAIYDGTPSPLVDREISEFENRMRLKTNVVGLKRNIAQYVFNNNSYPY